MTERSWTNVKGYLASHRIAVGSTAEIFRGQNTTGEKQDVVIKLLLPELSHDPEFSRLFLDEARISQALNHTNIVRTFEFGVFKDRSFLIQEYVEGPNLGMIMTQAKNLEKEITIPAAVEIVRQAAAGLDHAHRAIDSEGRYLHLIHRDISPQNILVSLEGCVKIIDFGIAKAAFQSTKTEIGTVRGRPRYMSPEQARGEQLDARSDQYSLGIVFYELLTGVNPLVVRSDRLNFESKESVPRVSAFRKDIPVDLERILDRMLAHLPEHRFESCLELKEAFDAFLGSGTDDARGASLAHQIHELFSVSDETPVPWTGISVGQLDHSTKPKRVIAHSYVLLGGVTTLLVGGTYLIQWEGLQNRSGGTNARAKTQERRQPSVPDTRIESQPGNPPSSPTYLIAAPAVMPAPSCPSETIMIPAGTFSFGSRKDDPDRSDLLEMTLQTVKHSAYCIDRFEYPNQKGALPRTQVSWFEASELCRNEGKRLCTQEEWERACKGVNNLRYPYGDTWNEKSCFTSRTTADRPSASGSFPSCRSSEGVFDLSGNAEEWTASVASFGPSRYIRRGGPWHLPAWAVRCASIRDLSPERSTAQLGFRCCSNVRSSQP